MDLFRQSQEQKIIGRPRKTINITASTQYLWKEGFIVYLVTLERNCVPWIAKTWWNSYCWRLPWGIDQIKPNIKEKTPRLRAQNTWSNFGPWQSTTSCWKTSQNMFVKHLMGRTTSRAVFTRILVPSNYYLFRSMQHGLSKQQFNSYEKVQNRIDAWLASKDERW